MPSPLPRWNCRVRSSRLFLCNAGLPRVSVRSASTTSVSRPHRAFTCVTACIFAGSPSDPFHQRLRRIRCLLRRFDCYWASDPSQAGLSPARIHTHSRRTDTLHNSRRAGNSSVLCPRNPRYWFQLNDGAIFLGAGIAAVFTLFLGLVYSCLCRARLRRYYAVITIGLGCAWMVFLVAGTLYPLVTMMETI